MLPDPISQRIVSLVYLLESISCSLFSAHISSMLFVDKYYVNIHIFHDENQQKKLHVCVF